MRRHLLALLAALAFFAAPAFALSTPDEVLTRARLGRADYIQVLGEVEAAAPSMSDKTQVYPYINILDQLKAIGTAYDVDTIGSGPLAEVAVALTRASIKFVRLDQDTTAQVATIERWAEDDVRFEIGQAQRAYLVRVSDKASLFTWLLDVGQVIDVLRGLGAQSYVLTSYEDLQDTATKGLVNLGAQLSNADVVRMLRAERSVAGFETFLTDLERRVLASNDPGFLKLAQTWDLIAATQLKTLNDVPTGVAQTPGEIAAEASIKLLQLTDSPDPSLALQLLDAMTERQSVDFLQNLIEVTKQQIGQNQVEFLYLTLQALIPRLEAAGLTKELQLAEALLARVAMLRASTNGSFEGTYEARVGGLPGKLTVADMGDSNFIMCLGLDIGGVPVYYSLFNVAYNFRDQTWEAHRFAVDDPRYVMPDWPVWGMKFTFKIDGAKATIDGTFSDTRSFQPIHAERAQPYNSVWGGTPAHIDYLAGGYTANASYGPETVPYLTISQVGQKLAGTLWFNHGAVKDDLVYGYYNRERGVFRLTSAELLSGQWVQVRGQVQNGSQLVGDYLIGGVGVQLDHVPFTKVDQ